MRVISLIISAQEKYTNMNNVIRLDGQQIIARKMRFGYCPEIEEQRRFLAQLIDMLIKMEDQVLEENGGDMQTVKFACPRSKLDTALGIFVQSLQDLEDVKTILKEPSFNRHMEQLNCFNWKFYHEHIYPFIYWKRLKLDD